ncbi:MAG: hypothetical protein R3E89_15890 [Thiolinea sp.]
MPVVEHRADIVAITRGFTGILYVFLQIGKDRIITAHTVKSGCLVTISRFAGRFDIVSEPDHQIPMK